MTNNLFIDMLKTSISCDKDGHEKLIDTIVKHNSFFAKKVYNAIKEHYNEGFLDSIIMS